MISTNSLKKLHLCINSLQLEDEVECLECACGEVEELLGPSDRPSNLQAANINPQVPSPLKESLAGTKAPSSHPCYESDRFDPNGKRWIKFKPVEDPLRVSIPRNDVESLLDLTTSPQGHLLKPSLVPGCPKADFIYRQFDNVVPPHFFLKNLYFKIHSMSDNGGKHVGKRGGSDKKHPYLVHFSGACIARRDGCPAKYDAGITEEDLIDFVTRDLDHLVASIQIHGQCEHLWKAVYSRVRGANRKKHVSDAATGVDKLIPPSRRAKGLLMSVEADDMVIGNHGGRATDRHIQYEINREAKEEQRTELGLSDDTLSNTVNMCQKIKVLDEIERKGCGDDSTDHLGLVQDSSYHNGFYALLFTKHGLQVRFLVHRMSL